MRKILFFVLAAFFSSCTTNEEKSEKLIKDYMFKNLYDISSYEPIETKLDSLFYDSYRDSTTLQYAYLVNERKLTFDIHAKKIEIIQKKFEIEELFAELSVSSREKMKELRADMKIELDSLNICYSQLNEYMEKIRKRSKDLSEKEFVGWKAQHRFRCKDKDGNYDIGDYVFIFDKNIESVVNRYDSDDEEMKNIHSIINYALDAQ